MHLLFSVALFGMLRIAFAAVLPACFAVFAARWEKEPVPAPKEEPRPDWDEERKVILRCRKAY